MSKDSVKILDNNVTMDMVIDSILETGTEEAFHIYDLGSIVKLHQLWTEVIPRVKTYYAVKCNNDNMVLKTVKSLGINFDCSSKSEMDAVLKLGVNAKRIVYSNTAKHRADLRHAKRMNIDLMTVDSESELRKIKELFPEARIMIRIQCDDPRAEYQFDEKFGCEVEIEAPRLLAVAKELKMNIVGVHFHIGSRIRDGTYVKRALEHSRVLFDAAKKMGFTPNVLDIGGGFVGINEQQFRSVMCVVNETLDKLFPQSEMIEIIAEPGRFYVEGCSTLLTIVTCARTVFCMDKSTGQETRKAMYYINDGVYGSFAIAIHEDVMEPLPFKPKNLRAQHNEELFESCVWGQTCDPCDRVVKMCFLPRLKEQDWLRFNNMGAYAIARLSSFNGFPVPKIYYVVHQKYWSQLKTLHPHAE